MNDTWVLRNMYLYPLAKISVFNQWGTLVFESNGVYDPWNGTYKGSRLPSATYYFIIDLANGDAPYTGPLTILE